MYHRLSTRTRRFNAVLSLATVLALLLSLFPFGIDLPGRLPDFGPQTASAHNLQTKFVYMFLDPATQTMLDNRISGGWTPGTPILQVNDEIGLIIKVVPRDGTSTGVGGHVDFYLPNGVTVTDVGYLLPNGSGGYVTVPMKGQSPIAIGDGPIGANSTAQLVGLGTNYTNINGVTEAPVVSASGLHRGTLAGVYGDTGIFYSTDPDTSWGSWQRFSNAVNPAEQDRCGVVGTFTLGGAKSITNNSGDTYVPCNKWDAEQSFAWGAKATTYAAAGSVPIVDYGDGRGNSPWGFAAGTGGPQSGYAWNFDWDEWQSSAKTAADMRNAMGNDEIGPWNRIKYAGSRISKDQPGLVSTTLGFASVDGSNVGANLPLPATTSQTDNTSPKTIRFAVGQLTDSRPEYAWVKIKINNTSAILNADGCPVFRGDTFGGDAGGTDNGKDHLWRYYEPSVVTWNGCLGIGKPSDRAAVKSGDTFQYKIKFYNLGTATLTSVVVSDLLPSGVTFLSAVPAQNSGPNPLVWNVGTLQPGQKFESLVTVRATGSGLLDNTVTVTSSQLPPQTSTETVYAGGLALLNPSKSVSPTSVAPGGTVQYTVVVQNLGTGPSGNPVTIQEYLPTGFTFVSKDSVTVNGANVTATTTVNTSLPYSTNRPFFTIPSAINAGQSLVLKFTAQVAANALPGSYCNYYTVTQNGVPLTTGSLGCVSVGGNAVSDFVWRDWDGDGVQDPGEEGIAGVQVCATPTGGGASVCTTTDANGNYVINGLTDGSYNITVTTPPAGSTPTYDLNGVGTPNTTTVSLSGNQVLTTVDFGYKPGGAGTIGNQVFDDQNNNGIFAGADVGINGVTVNLYEDTNGDGVIDPVNDLLIATTTTNASGVYSFTGLDPTRSYIVDPVDGAGSPVDAYFTNPYFPSTTNPNAVSPQDFIDQGNNVTDADFGYFGQIPSSIGDQVFKDADNDGVYDAGEQTLPFVTVYLYQDTNGNGVLDLGEPLLRTTETDATGVYLFDNLGPGSYIVDVNQADPQVPGGYMASTDLIAVTLSSNDHRTNVDFPFVPLISKQVDKTSAQPGDTLNYTINVQYGGYDLLTDVVVTDTVPAGTTYVGGSANASGVYSPTVNTITWNLGSNTAGAPAFTGSAVGTTSFQATQDTKLQINNPTNNYGTDTTIQVKVPSRSERRALLKFNVSSLAGQTVSNATLRFRVNNNGAANTRIDIYPVTKSWDSTGTNWTKATATTNWTTAGGDFNPGNLLGSFVPSTNNIYYDVTSPAINTLVQNWINNPSVNYGVILVMVGDADEVQMRSMEDTNSPSQKPELVVTTNTGLKPAINPTQDTWIDQGSPATINAAENPLKVVNNNAEQRSLLQWDVSSIPAGATILSAGVRLYFSSGNSAVKLNLYRTVKTWNELQATWMLAATGNNWAMPGGDYTTSLGGFQAAAANNTYQSYQSAALAGLVQGWVDGSVTNQGVLVIPSAAATNQSATFVSSEGTALQQPELFITYRGNTINQTLQTKIPQGVSNGQDTYIDIDNPGNNYGHQTVIQVRPPAANASRGVVHFNLSGVSGTVSAATLSFTVNNATAAGSRVDVYPLTRGFTELQTTWDIAATGTNWTAPGGDYDASNRIGTFSPTATGVYNITGAALNTLVQSWINSGATNFGLILVMEGEANDTQVRTVDQGAPDEPKLSVTTNNGTSNLIADKDSELRQSNPTTNYGGANAMVILRASDVQRGLVQWDFTGLQPDATVTAATMSFNVVAANANLTVGVHQALHSWEEGVGDNTLDADWLRWDDDNNAVTTADRWATPGGDFASTALGSFAPSLPLGWKDVTGASVISLVQGWMDGSIANNGVFLRATGTPNNQADFASVGTVDNVNSPKLTFTFNGTSRETHTLAGPSLVGNGGAIQVSMELSTTQTINTVTPVLNVSGTNGVTATCGSPTPTPPVNVVAGTPVTFKWTCTANANGNIGALTFTGSATSPSNLNFAASTSNSVLVAPPLTFQATVNTIAPPTLVNNTAYIAGSGEFPPFTPSNTVLTAIGANIGDFVWMDVDGDGIQDAGEPGIAGVQVCATPTGGGSTVCATTDANGYYRIAGLTNGVSYNVTENPATYPAGYAPTTPTTVTVTATTAGTNTADFGLRPPGTASIGDTVWLDKDEDGVKDADESGLPSITVRLYIDQNNDGLIDGGDTLLQTATTDANGNYLFSGLHPDDYLVQVVTTSSVTTPNGVVTTIGAAMDPTFGTTNPRDVTITTAGQTITNADFGYNWGGSIGDRLWYDNDGDKIGPAGTPGGTDSEPYVAVGGVLNLYYDTNANGEVDPGEPIVAVALADGSGYYLFDNLPPGNYVVKAEEQQVPAPPSSPNAGQIGVMVATTGSSHAVSLAASQDYTQADFGFIEASEMEGHVFYDVNGNGILDAGETVLPNVTVTITPPAGVDLGAGPGNPISTTTDGDGEWSFIVPPGTYTVTYTTGDPDIPASLTQATTPVSFSVTQIAGQERSGLDFGRDNSGVIGDRVWSDPDADGVQDGGEPGLSSVTVNLYRDNNNSNTLDGGDTFLAAMTTDASGLYQFTGLADGNYIVQVDPASLVGYTQTYDNVGALDRVGQADISGGNTNLLVDFGFKYTLGGASLFTLSGRVYDDANNSGNDESETGFSNVTVTVVCTILGTVTAQTDATGAWSVAGVPNGDTCTVLDADETDLPRTDYVATETPSTPITVTGDVSGLDFGYNQQPGSISGTVCDGTNDGFCDDPGDSPLVGVAVSLRWAGPDGILNTADDVVTNTATNGFGNYSFTNLQPGLYQIVETNPSGYASLADADGGNPDNISQMSSSSFVLGLGENAVDRDFEDAAQDSSVGDFVWRDLDADGIQDGGEVGVQGVTVELWQVGGVVPFLTTTTNASGYYSFTAPAGDYFIDFIPPVGYVLSPKDVDDGNPNPDQRDSDPDIVTGRTANFTLASGANVTTWDAGLYQVDLAVDKSQQTPSNRTVFYVGEQVTFQVLITNTGESTISLLPLTDLFDNACLEYSTKAASPEESAFDNLNGIIDWNNLTVINAQYLDPNEAFTVTIPFDVVGSSLSGYNTALVEGAVDVNSNNVPDADDTINFICVEADFGDAPQPTYPTKLDQNGARHVIVPGFYLGASVDSEPDGQPAAAATGDDLAVSDDEDGVSFGPFFPGSSTTVTVTASASGRLDGWIDFADDGSWSQAGDQVFTNLPLAPGVNILSVPVPAGATLTSQTFARFRFSSTGNLSFTGLANDGEVEDYALAIVAPASIGDFVYFDSNGNGVQDGGETSGINAVPVSLTNIGTGQVWNTVTVNGAYLFSNLPSGTYQVSVPSSVPGLVRTTTSPHVVTVVSGQNYTQADFGYIAPTGVAISSFTAMDSNDGVMVRWTTFSEEDITGFVVWRASESEGSYQSVSALIPSQGESGASYGWLDAEAGAGHTYWYKLQSQPNGQFFGPIFNQPEGGFKKLFAPMILRSR